MLSAFLKAFSQLFDPTFRKVLLKAVLGAIMVFVGLGIGLGYLLKSTTLFDIGYLETITDVLGGLMLPFLVWFLFTPVALALAGFMLDPIADAVEKKHYPHLPEPRKQEITEITLEALKFMAIMILLNILILPFYLVTGPLNLFVFYVANGYLFSREYFELVAQRRMLPKEARIFRKAHQGSLVFGGAVIAFFMTVPFINLVTPLVGTAVMVHLFHRWQNAAATPATT